MILGSIVEKYHFVIGHEASFLILLGILISLINFEIGHQELIDIMQFDEKFFFYFCLPPIVFASGYNMKRQKFFENFRNILLFGLFGTCL
jgi:NhaP-type Na+/H+ or K+/H+ antiporter